MGAGAKREKEGLLLIRHDAGERKIATKIAVEEESESSRR